MLLRRPQRTKAEIEVLAAKVAELAWQGFGMTETALLLGEHRPILNLIRRRPGRTEKRQHRSRPGDPERADRLLRRSEKVLATKRPGIVRDSSGGATRRSAPSGAGKTASAGRVRRA